MKKIVRLAESDLHRIVKESVNKALNKSNSVFYDDRPSKITKVDRSNSSNKHTMSPDEIEKIHNIVSEVSVAPNGFKHRFDPNKRDGDFPLEQPEWTKDPRWQGWNGEDPEWIMKQQEKYPYGGESKQSVRVSEAQLHQIVKESVEKVMNEGWFGNDAKYGEKWYNPLTWVSDKEKTRIDQAERERKKRLRDIDRRKAEREKEDAEGYRRWRQSEAEKAQRKYAQNYSSGLACHAGEYYDPMRTSSYDAGLR